jgi:hypothetical protein
MKGPPQIEDFDRVLVVEGYSDLRFYAELLEYVGKSDQVFIKPFSGREDLTTQFEAFLTPSLLAEKSAIAVIVDADQNPLQAEQRLIATLHSATRQNITPGAWTNGRPRIGLFLVPGQGQPGEIETLVWQSWAADPPNQRQRACVEQFAECMQLAGAKPRSPDKGLISALLAIRNDDDPRLGPGAQKRVFDFSRPEYHPLRKFLAEF